MKYKRFIFLACLVIFSCRKEEHAKAPTSEKSVDTLKVFSLKQENLEKHISLPGELMAYERVEVRPKVNGYVKQLNVDIGSPVKKGQVIAVIDAPEVQSRLGEGSGRMNAAKAKYQASLDTYKRIVFASRTPGVISPSEIQKALNQMLADSADFEAQKFALASYRQIGNYLAITAPFTGVITQRNVNEGSYVGGANEKPILVVEDNHKLRLRVAVSEALTGVLLKDNTVKFTTKAYPNKSFTALLVRKSGSIDAGTRTETWEFEADNAENLLKAGSFATVVLDISRSTPSFMVPFSAVVTTLEKKFVVKISNDTIRWVDVSPGLNLSEKTEIFGELKTGDTLVLKANEELRPEVRVAVKFQQ